VLGVRPGTGSSQPRSRHRLSGGTDRIERVGLRAVATRSPLRAIQLDDDLRHLQQVTTQTGAVTTGPLDRPSAQHRVVVGELHQLGIALGCRLDGDLVKDTTSRSIDHGRGVGMDVGVDADDDIDHLAQIGQTVHAFSPSPDGTWFRSGTENRQDCDETRQAPLTPGGQAPDQASSSNRAGAGDRERTGRTKARSQSFRGSHPRSPTTAQHLQTALAILTVIPPLLHVSTFACVNLVRLGAGRPGRHRVVVSYRTHSGVDRMFENCRWSVLGLGHDQHSSPTADRRCGCARAGASVGAWAGRRVVGGS
jgi:hypothetical protein